MTHVEILKQYFGYDHFRNGQEELIQSLLQGRDCLGIMPTGAGKSICFQVPALMQDGITLIISPLISLMKDQVNALTQAGIPAAFINSSLTERQISLALQNACNGAYKLIYIAPERLATSNLLAFAQNVHISMVTVDEAHCVSQWGQDFRPSYAKIPEFISTLSSRPVVSAFTATATPKVREDILTLLQLQNPTVLVTGFDRDNLYFEVQKPQKRFVALVNYLDKQKDKCGIVYCTTRNTVEDVCEKLREKGYNAGRYHAGLSDLERHQNQDDFLYDRTQIMVATNAFGMGIDKSNVSFVVHYNMPKDLESYYQEAGRAGRDGTPADCILFYNGQDVRTGLWMIENARDMESINTEIAALLKERDRKRLREMTLFCTTNECLRAYILRYFGEHPPETCDHCGNCNAQFETLDVTMDAKKILSCVARMKERFGTKMVMDVLRGVKNEKIQRLELDKLSTYGISEKSEQQLRGIIHYLILHQYLHQTNDTYPLLRLGEHAATLLRGDETVVMKYKQEGEQATRTSPKHTPMAPMDRGLFGVLRDLRLKIANVQKVPAFVIFSDSTLTDMCIKIPVTEAEFLNVSGVGAVKWERYGKEFLQAIVKYKNEIPTDTNTEPTSLPPLDKNTIEISDEPVTISLLADHINSVLMQSGYKRITGAKINDWLIAQGYMEKYTENETNFKIPTEKGLALGITNHMQIIRGQSSRINRYSRDAQEYLVAQLEALLAFCS